MGAHAWCGRRQRPVFLPRLLYPDDGVQDPPDALAMPIKFLFTPTLDNFYSVFQRADIQGGGTTDSGFSHYFFNSLFIGGTSVSLALIIGTAAAYGFSRFPLRGNDTYLFIILTTRMLPPIIAIIPIFVLFRVFGLSG